MAAHSESLAMSVIVSKGVPQLANTLATEAEDHVQSATCWTIGQVGRHTPEHAKAIAQANLLPKLLHAYMRTDASDDLQLKVRVAFLSSTEFRALLSTCSRFFVALLAK